MLRTGEIGWFLVPFVLFASWRILGDHARPQLMWIAPGLLVLMAALATWYGFEAGKMAAGQRYVPAHLENGRVIPGHAAP